MNYRVAFEPNPHPEELQWLLSDIAQYNLQQAGMWVKPFTIFARNPQNKVVGGLRGVTVLNGLFVDVLHVEASLRKQGLGKKMMLLAEVEARKAGCTFIHTDTFTFQAPDFYLKLGYQVFGELDYANNVKRYFLKKAI